MKAIICCIIVTCFLSAGASAQTTEAETLQALLTEVRQLRAVVEVFAAAVPQAHIAVQRLQFQQQRVTQLSDQLAGLRSQIEDQVRQQSELARQVEEENEWLKGDIDGTQREMLEQQFKNTKTLLDAATLLEQQLRVREAELYASLNSEQAKLSELERQLARLERSLAAVGNR